MYYTNHRYSDFAKLLLIFLKNRATKAALFSALFALASFYQVKRHILFEYIYITNSKGQMKSQLFSLLASPNIRFMFFKGLTVEMACL